MSVLARFRSLRARVAAGVAASGLVWLLVGAALAQTLPLRFGIFPNLPPRYLMTTYQPLAKYREPVRGILVVRADSRIGAVTDLRGKRVAVADPLAVFTLAMRAFAASATGQKLFKGGGYGGFADGDPDELATLWPYARRVKYLLERSP